MFENAKIEESKDERRLFILLFGSARKGASGD